MKPKFVMLNIWPLRFTSTLCKVMEKQSQTPIVHGVPEHPVIFPFRIGFVKNFPA